jgi:hypothetical protein
MIDAMLASGLTAEQALMAVKAISSVRSTEAVRKARSRANVTDSHGQSRTGRDNPDITPSPLAPLDKETSPTPPKEINPPLTPQPRKRAFEEFWAEYPNKVGKPKAQEAFSKALTKTDVETLMAGLRLYVSKTDDRPWCNPATWLNQDRWGDQPAQVARGSPPRRRTIADAASDLLKEFQNADIRPEPSNQSIAAPVRYLPPSFLDK